LAALLLLAVTGWTGFVTAYVGQMGMGAELDGLRQRVVDAEQRNHTLLADSRDLADQQARVIDLLKMKVEQLEARLKARGEQPPN
jgi:hypothetical protein